MREKVIVIAFVVSVISFVCWTWDFYMRHNWDNHLVSTKPRFFSLKQDVRDGGGSLTEQEIEALPNHYKLHFEIVKRYGTYYWINNRNMRLIKTVEITEGKTPFKWIYFTSEDGSVKIQILGNKYLSFSVREGVECYASDLFLGNAIIYYPYEKDRYKYLTVRTYVNVYENIIQQYFCRNYARPFGNAPS